MNHESGVRSQGKPGRYTGPGRIAEILPPSPIGYGGPSRTGSAEAPPSTVVEARGFAASPRRWAEPDPKSEMNDDD